ncbi:MAG: hypothetical protein Q8L89_08950 [Gammaproteobacteria bacterium]|nr:hypothetical protein [Gammaproteobacteria bacterium]
MARIPRFVIPGQPQHIILRGNNRTEIFCADADYRFYLENQSSLTPLVLHDPIGSALILIFGICSFFA